ncbi:MAG: rhodanese-like domain-containing protein [Deltaproteobacteria bacterium]|nr:rhodanese-like domain-containing protein [Deltaproteobacteria bacterium]
MGLKDWVPWKGNVEEISATELARALKAGEAVQIVDVRTVVEFRQSRIAGARHLPITDFQQTTLAALAFDADRPIVAICRSAHRSLPAVRKMTRWGFRARQLQGGMLAWWSENHPCESGD